MLGYVCKAKYLQYPSIQCVGLLGNALVRDGTGIDCIYLSECNTSCRVVFVYLFVCLFTASWVDLWYFFLLFIYLFIFIFIFLG